MSSPAQNLAVVATGISRLTSALRGQANCRALLAAYLQPIQDLETAAWGVYSGFILKNATLYTLPQTNPVLDVIGGLVGLPRSGLQDSDYQSMLFVKAAATRSKGRMQDLSAVVGILLRTSSGPVTYFEGVAAFALFVGGMTLNPNMVASILSQSDPNGVGPNLLGYSTWPDGNDFEWCDANNPTSTGQGTWGDSVGGQVGGVMVSAAAM